MTSVLVTGAAGRLGSQIAAALAQKGVQVVGLDSLVTGDSSRIKHGPLVKVDVRETPRVIRTLKEYSITEVVHAALIASDDPGQVYDQHLGGVLSLVAALRDTGGKKLTVYANDERTFDMIERILQDSAAAYGFDARVLRAFAV